MLHPVKVFDAKGRLKRIISTEELLRLSAAAFKKKQPYRSSKNSILITCEFCGDKAKVRDAFKTNCKKKKCTDLALKAKQERQSKVKGKHNERSRENR